MLTDRVGIQPVAVSQRPISLPGARHQQGHGRTRMCNGADRRWLESASDLREAELGAASRHDEIASQRDLAVASERVAPPLPAMSGFLLDAWAMPAKPRRSMTGRSPATKALRSIPTQTVPAAPVTMPRIRSLRVSSSSRAAAIPRATDDVM